MKKRMRVKVLSLWSGVQIAMGVALLVGTVGMAVSVLPRLGSVFGRAGESLSESARALEEISETYCGFATNMFVLAGNIDVVANQFDAVGRSVVKTGQMFHFDLPLLGKVNGIGESVCNIGNNVRRAATAIRNERNVIVKFRDNGHRMTENSFKDAVSILNEFSELMRTGDLMCAYGWYVCLLGVMLSLLFIMNGVILLAIKDLVPAGGKDSL